MRIRALLPLLTLVALAVSSVGCAALDQSLGKAETNYAEARYENALTWLTELERDVPDMSPKMRARYYYLRGMTHYRLDDRNDALHYLAVAREVSGKDGIGLTRDERKTMDRTLSELMPTKATFRARGTEGSEREIKPAGQQKGTGPAGGAQGSGGTRGDTESGSTGGGGSGDASTGGSVSVEGSASGGSSGGSADGGESSEEPTGSDDDSAGAPQGSSESSGEQP